jgi:dihydroorotase-like cyclic amidohydrolase
MFLPDLVVRSQRVVVRDAVRPASIHVRQGKIIGVADFSDLPAGCALDDAPDMVVMPGLIEPHTHLSDVEAESRAAAAAGVTTIIDTGPSTGFGPGPAVASKFWVDIGRRCEPSAATPIFADLGSADCISELIELCRVRRAPLHIVHFTSWEALTPLFQARRSHLPLTAATCPHCLYFVRNERDRENREYLWAALAGSLLDLVASTHSAPSLRLPLTWTEGSARGYSLTQLAQWLCGAPARIAGLKRKGAIDVGYDADLVLWRPDAELTIEGRRCRGVVERTYLRGVRIHQREDKQQDTPHGRLLSRDGV